MRKKHAASKHGRWCKKRPDKMQNAPSVQNTPGKMRKKHAGSKHGRWCKTRPLVQNTPGKFAIRTVGAEHARKMRKKHDGAKHARKNVKQTVDAKYWENIYLLKVI
jgi:hypothetical protein